ncbi:MAG: recombinase family protein [Clostridia bacterium]|nr:recombinase family protein [Clostridia bacterium]
MKSRHAALYIRVSTDSQADEGYSIEAQKDMLEGYCRSRGWKDYEFYIDGGFTGSNIDRPEMKRLIGEARAGRISQVVVYKLDRLSRSQKDTLFLIEDVFNPAGIGFTSLNENMDTSTPMGRAMLGIMSAFAQLERETIRERTRMGMKERVRTGLWMGGGHPPFGYDYDSDRGVLVPNADAETVRLIYRLYLEGLSTARIAAITGMKHDKQVRDILSRKSNIGLIEYNGAEYRGRHEPIVDEAVFQAAQEQRRRRASARGFQSGHLLTGLVYCGRCGARMRYQKWGAKGFKLTCYSQQSSKRYLIRDENCDNEKAWADEVEAAVTGDFLDRALSLPEQTAEEAGETVGTRLAERIREAERRLKRLYDLYAAGEDDVLAESISAQKRLLEALRAEAEREEAQRVREETEVGRRDEIRRLAQAWDRMTQVERRSVVRELIERVEIDGPNISIHYRL